MLLHTDSSWYMRALWTLAGLLGLLCLVKVPPPMSLAESLSCCRMSAAPQTTGVAAMTRERTVCRRTGSRSYRTWLGLQSSELLCRAEFLKVAVSLSCDAAKFCWICAKSWDMYTKTRKVVVLTIFYIFFIFNVTVRVFLANFLAQNF